jgi:hypothetical protein
MLPTPDQLRAVADQCGLSLTAEDIASFRGLMQGSIEAYNAVDAMPDEVPVVNIRARRAIGRLLRITRATPGIANRP